MVFNSHSCFSCSNQLKNFLRIEDQPISNRFIQSPKEAEYTYPITLSKCTECGLIQLNDLVPWENLTPRYGWIKYNEPEEHLDHLVRKIINLPNITQKSRFLGATYKDDTTLKRLSERGFDNSYRLSAKDLGIDNPNSGIETIQERLTPNIAERIKNMHGAFDVVIARHIIEHAYNPSRFIKSLRTLASPKGYIIFEVPDISGSLKNRIYTAIWEEHTLYFTPSTFQRICPFFDLSVFDFHLYPYPIENSLVAITKQSSTPPTFPDRGEMRSEIFELTKFSNEFSDSKNRMHEFCRNYRENGGRIAFLGAGHHSCAFINYFDLSKYIDFVADDDPNKQGMYMPGSRIPICNSRGLHERGVGLCLMALSPQSEQKACERNKDFIENGGKMVSAFRVNTQLLK